MEKEMKTKGKIGGYIIRSAAYAVFLAVAFIAASSAFDSPNKWYKSLVATVGYGSTAKSPSQPRALGFAERVAFQRAIEDVYWRHRIWPNENSDRKPPLDAVMSQAQLENKVAAYLRESLLLQDWQKPITAEQLQVEMNRMARDTKQPEVLQELFGALVNDPAVIAECLARPILAERLIADLSVQGETQRVESPPAEAIDVLSIAISLGQLVYTLPRIADMGDSPCTDNTWTSTSTTNAPAARTGHTAVWTGSEMIIWGGCCPFTNTGGRYNPSTDTWTATSTTNAPSGRVRHTAVWTGNKVIFWGGSGTSADVNTGGRYDPVTDTWHQTTTTNAPSARDNHTAVWTGSEMIIWGGAGTNTGGRYNPNTNSWTATSTANAPFNRSSHTAVWTGSEMIVWGGYGGSYLNTGGRYGPITDSWIATTTINPPSARTRHTAVWTGSEMIVWGGDNDSGSRPNTGGKYNPSTNSWTATSTTSAPEGRFLHTTVWTGTEMIVWGGTPSSIAVNTGGRYDPSSDSWESTSTTDAPEPRDSHTAVWTGGEMTVWGGNTGGYPNHNLNTGGRYCAQSGPTPTPTATPTPTPTPTPCEGRCAPTPRLRPTPAPRPSPATEQKGE
jgi:N-acetylneuraminic acid mutarotase